MASLATARRESFSFEGQRMVFQTARSFDKVRSALMARVGRASVENVVSLDGSIEDYERSVSEFVGESGFILFAEMDHGRWIERYGIHRRLVRWVFGNPLIAITMLKFGLSAGLFVPVELLLAEAEDGRGCSVTYLVPSSLMSVGENPGLLAAARILDAKIGALIEAATADMGN